MRPPFPATPMLTSLHQPSTSCVDFPAGDNLVLIGIMGAGKSSIARELAPLSLRKCVDTDRLVIQKAGLPIAKIFAQHGEEYFRDLETAALRSLGDARRMIIATGGGIVSRPENVALLRNLGCVIWLTASEDVLFERVSRNQKRPLLQTPHPRQTLVELLARRRPLYEACAHCAIDTTHLTHAEAAAAAFAAARAFYRSAGHDCCSPSSARPGAASPITCCRTAPAASDP
jgi:shikimate kinase